MNSLKVGVPCPKQWEELAGNESRRYCDQCEKHVHNLSVASKRETLRLTRELEAGGRVCVAYFTTPSGGILRQPARWRRWFGSLQSGLALLLPFALTGVQAAPPSQAPEEHREARLSADGEIVMGQVAAPRPTPTPTPVRRGEAIAILQSEITLGDVVLPKPSPSPEMTMGSPLPPKPSPTTPASR